MKKVPDDNSKSHASSLRPWEFQGPFKRAPVVTAGVFLLWLAWLAGCGPAAGPPKSESGNSAATRTFAVRGVVQEIKPDGRTVIIQHEEIPGYMVAMTMPFTVKQTNELTGIGPGDQVSFRMVVTPTDGWIEGITRLAQTNLASSSSSPELFRRVREVEPLNIGDALPDYPFTNELGQAVHLKDFRGQALAFTFMFTRCPFPTFCPKMSSNFAEAYRALVSSPELAGKWHFLTITFDPQFDTPATLKRYAERYHYDPKHWNFLTGALIEIDALTEQFGLYFAREGVGGFNFNHNLRTVVINPNGTVRRVFTGNEWPVADLIAEMKAAAL